MSKTQIFRLLAAGCGIWGVSIQLHQGGAGMLLYYTVLSNILTFSFMLYLVYYEAKRGTINSNPHLLRIKGGVTMAIAITFMIYHFLLAPRVEPEDFWNIRNFLVHYIAPFCLIFDTLILDRRNNYKWQDPFYWTVIPLLYFAFAIFNGTLLQLPVPGSKDSPFPYFFINTSRYGWETVAKNTVLIAIAYLLFCYVLVFLKKKIGVKNK
ncbi:Pr6Pr family membrane protein [Streptococcus sp. H31]|uniref:Pr6Pr family membrane protein n=1 Tax=Streptococcus huangxiaojuni TaxID=3237239 RepID=UPI0034A1000D